MITTICVAGAGTMGSGIALVSAQNNFNTILFDLAPAVLNKARAAIRQNISYLVDKKKISPEEGERTFNRIVFTSNVTDCVAHFFIEAIIEAVAAKTDLFNSFASFNDARAIFATNTSSLSVSAIQAGVLHPERVGGMHFFNPAPVMKLVEVVRGKQTSEATAQAIYGLCRAMQKTPVFCRDAPGFIVNRVARHYYLEAMKMVQQGVAGVEEIDVLMEASGFKMGPFKLMDLIGMDINLAVTQGIYEAYEGAIRFTPSPLQEEKVARGELGVKTGQGFYTYPAR